MEGEMRPIKTPLTAEVGCFREWRTSLMYAFCATSYLKSLLPMMSKFQHNNTHSRTQRLLFQFVMPLATTLLLWTSLDRCWWCWCCVPCALWPGWHHILTTSYYHTHQYIPRIIATQKLLFSRNIFFFWVKGPIH